MKKLNLTLFFMIVAAAIFSSCKKDGGSKSTTITAAYYFKGTLNGQALTWQATNDMTGYYTGSAGTLSNDQGVITGGLTALLSASTGLQPQLGIEFRTFQVNTSQDIPAYFNGFVNTGAWAFATTADYPAGVKAIAIYYTDSTGKQYSSIGSQAGNSSNVAAVTPIPAQLGTNESLKIKATFSCTLYPVDGTGSNLSLTGAEATVLLEDLLY
jgi:hypothetical protein